MEKLITMRRPFELPYNLACTMGGASYENFHDLFVSLGFTDCTDLTLDDAFVFRFQTRETNLLFIRHDEDFNQWKVSDGRAGMAKDYWRGHITSARDVVNVIARISKNLIRNPVVDNGEFFMKVNKCTS